MNVQHTEQLHHEIINLTIYDYTLLYGPSFRVMNVICARNGVDTFGVHDYIFIVFHYDRPI